VAVGDKESILEMKISNKSKTKIEDSFKSMKKIGRLTLVLKKSKNNF
jgi:hypothetical protein